VKRGEGNTNSLEFLLLKYCPPVQPFLGHLLGFHIFFPLQNGLLQGSTLFYSWAVLD